MADIKNDVPTTRSKANDLKLKMLPSCDLDLSTVEDSAKISMGSNMFFSMVLKML